MKHLPYYKPTHPSEYACACKHSFMHTYTIHSCACMHTHLHPHPFRCSPMYISLLQLIELSVTRPAEVSAEMGNQSWLVQDTATRNIGTPQLVSIIPFPISSAVVICLLQSKLGQENSNASPTCDDRPPSHRKF